MLCFQIILWVLDVFSSSCIMRKESWIILILPSPLFPLHSLLITIHSVPFFFVLAKMERERRKSGRKERKNVVWCHAKKTMLTEGTSASERWGRWGTKILIFFVFFWKCYPKDESSSHPETWRRQSRGRLRWRVWWWWISDTSRDISDDSNEGREKKFIQPWKWKHMREILMMSTLKLPLTSF